MATSKTSAKSDGFKAVVKAFAKDRDVTPPGDGKGFGKLTLVAIEPCQCIEAGRSNGMFRSQYLLANHEGTRKVGDRILIAQDLGLPLPNCTCGLSPHTALTESPTFF